jgi:hypothetical protein
MVDKITTNDGGPAFASQACSPIGDWEVQHGMSLRDYFATHVDISGMNLLETYTLRYGKGPSVLEISDYASKIKYVMADAMIKARATTQENTDE